jgi:hypothetical protein
MVFMSGVSQSSRVNIYEVTIVRRDDEVVLSEGYVGALDVVGGGRQSAEWIGGWMDQWCRYWMRDDDGCWHFEDEDENEDEEDGMLYSVFDKTNPSFGSRLISRYLCRKTKPS